MDAKIKIKYVSGDGTINSCELDESSANNYNNVSKKNYTRLNTEIKEYKCIYVSGEDYEACFLDNLDYGLFGSEEYTGYYSRERSSTEKKDSNVSSFEDEYEFEAGSAPTFIVNSFSQIDSVLVVFDDMNGEYAPSITIKYEGGEEDGESLKNHHCVFMYNFELPVSEFTIRFDSWNKPNEFVKINVIDTSFERTYTKNQLINFTASKENRSDPKNIEFGLSSQYGSIEILDNNKEFRVLNECGLLQDDLDVSVELHEGGKVIPIGKYKSQSWDLYENRMTAKLELTDVFERFKNININLINLNALYYDDDGLIEVSVLDLINKLLKIRGVPEFEIEENFDSANIDYIELKDLYLEKGTVYDALKKALALCKLRMYVGTTITDNNKWDGILKLYKVR